jgi:hypothetical protein
MLYEVRKPDGTMAKVGIGKAEDTMPTRGDANRRAEASARAVRKNPDFVDAQAYETRAYEGITKGEMKEIEAARVRDLRTQGHELPYNRERDRRYKPSGKC